MQWIWTSRVWLFVSGKLFVGHVLAFLSPHCSLNGLLYYLFLALGIFYFRALSASLNCFFPCSPTSHCLQFWICEKPRFFWAMLCTYSVSVTPVGFPLLTMWFEIRFFQCFFFMFSYSFEPCFLWQCSGEWGVFSPRDYLNFICII